MKVHPSTMDNLVQHELSHLYGARDRSDFHFLLGQPSVMSKPTGLYVEVRWGWVDVDIIEPRNDQFDGV